MIQVMARRKMCERLMRNPPQIDMVIVNLVMFVYKVI